jgi:agmatine deiminase
MNVKMPAEFAAQDWIWICFPHDASLWVEDLVPAQEQMAAFANAVAETGQQVRLVVRDAANEMRARELVSANVVCEHHPYGDIWVRDSGPLVLLDGKGGRIARRFGFNGWGGKYLLDGDQDVGESMARAAGLPVDHMDWVLEGGAIDTDGTGLVVTTRQCLLHPNRNPALSQADIEARLHKDLGFDRILWLGDGLAGDHTDGHVDNLARFVATGHSGNPGRQRRGRSQCRGLRRCARARAGFRAGGARRSLAGAAGHGRGSDPGQLHELHHLQPCGGGADLWFGP